MANFKNCCFCHLIVNIIMLWETSQSQQKSPITIHQNEIASQSVAQQFGCLGQKTSVLRGVVCPIMKRIWHFSKGFVKSLLKPQEVTMKTSSQKLQCMLVSQQPPYSDGVACSQATGIQTVPASYYFLLSEAYLFTSFMGKGRRGLLHTLHSILFLFSSFLDQFAWKNTPHPSLL